MIRDFNVNKSKLQHPKLVQLFMAERFKFIRYPCLFSFLVLCLVSTEMESGEAWTKRPKCIHDWQIVCYVNHTHYVVFWSERSACDQRSNLGRPLFWSERSACASGQHSGGHYFKISAHVDGGLSGGSRVRRPGSEDPHRRERKFESLTNNNITISFALGCGNKTSH